MPAIFLSSMFFSVNSSFRLLLGHVFRAFLFAGVWGVLEAATQGVRRTLLDQNKTLGQVHFFTFTTKSDHFHQAPYSKSPVLSVARVI